MQKEITVRLSEAVYDGLLRKVEPEDVSAFIEHLVRPRVLGVKPELLHGFSSLEEGYAAMAADEEHEAQAQEWCNAVIGDIPDEPW